VLAAVEDVLDDLKLTTLAFAIAIGWSIYQVAYGVAQVVEGLTSHVSSDDIGGVAGGSMTWVIGHRVLTLDTLVAGLVELTVALVIAALVRRHYGYAEPEIEPTVIDSPDDQA
jgi:hypothetical protein